MEDINITGADFGSNLPKWATDETLRRLKRVIENDSARDKKISRKLLACWVRLYLRINQTQISTNKL